jgi:ABC-type glycerol-3-phosphate transport system substrate-binding protein
MKKILMVMLALVIAIVPLSGCKKNGDEVSMISVWVDEEGNPVTNGDTDTDDANGTTASGSTSSGKSNGNGSSNGSGNKGGTASATKPVDGKYDFGGKTYTMAITDEEQYNTTSFKQMKAAFEKKYNLKIKTTKLVFNDYNKMVSQKMATGTSYDICYIHGSMFPGCVVGGSVLYNDLTEATNLVKSSVINTNRSKDLFSWDGKLYGVVADNSCFVHLMYYNKYKFQSAGLEDPRELYEKGQWTWDKIFEQGTQVAKAGEIFFGHQNEVVNLYGENAYYLKDGKFYNNIRSANVRKGLELLKKIYVGNDAIGSMSTYSQEYVDGFKNGLFYIMIEEHSKYPSFAEAAAKSALCGKSADNAGIVPIPLPAENTSKAYPTGWYTAIASGKGSDPTVAVLWADFSQGYESPVKSKYELTGDNLALVEKLQAGNTLPVRHGMASNNTTTTGETWGSIYIGVKNGGDINQLIEKYYPIFNDCVVTTCGKDRLVEVK